MKRVAPPQATSSKTGAARSTWHPPTAGEPRLKICVVAACPFPANHGTPGSIRELVEATAERGHEVHVVTYHIGQDLPVRGAQIHRIANWTGEQQVVVGPTRNRPLYDFQMIFRTLEVIWRHDLDLIHAHGYESALVAACCRPFVQRPVLYSAHNQMGDELASYDFFPSKRIADAVAWLLDRTVPRIGDRCIPHSANLQQFLIARGLAERSEPILNFGIDLGRICDDSREELRNRFGIGSGPVILYSGVMDRFQRLDLLLSAMADVKPYAPEVKLVLVKTVANEKHESALRLDVERLGLTENVLWIPATEMDEALGILPVCDIAVVPRPGAPGFPIKLLNFMAARRACVMFRSSASGVVHGEHVWLADEDTSKSLAAGIIRLLDDVKLRDRLAAGGHAFVRAHHDRRIVADRLCQAYVRTLEASRRWDIVASRLPVGKLLDTDKQLELSEPAGEAGFLEVGAHAVA